MDDRGGKEEKMDLSYKENALKAFEEKFVIRMA